MRACRCFATGLALAAVLLLVFASPAAAATRPAALAGTWYPADPAQLRAGVEGFLARVKPETPHGRPAVLIAPHAGHAYSGQVAAHAFALLKDRPVKTVIMVGPSHRARFQGVSLDTRDYQTPLGLVPTDRKLAGEIMAAGGKGFSNRPEVHTDEHCLEIELPFLQAVLNDFRIVPIIMGSQDQGTCRALADALTEVLRRRGDAVVLISTDLSHFHTGEEARALDRVILDRVEKLDPDGLYRDLAAGRAEACGGGGLVAGLMTARSMGADKGRVLAYAHSGDVTGDNSRVVGYMSAVFELPESRPQARSGVDLGLTKDEQRLLLEIARRSVEAGLKGESYSPPDELPPGLIRPGGAFVTLKRHGELRGCIGRLESDQPLAVVTAEMAVQAAFSDPRFPPLTRSELDGLTVEISVLTPFERVVDVAGIQVGVHGLMIVHGHSRGLLLPQVPVEWNWNRDEFLEQTCRKAGLPRDAWRRGAEIYRFSAQIFGEGE